MSIAAAEQPRRVRHCFICRRPGYWVSQYNEETKQRTVFFVTHDGRRWCPVITRKSTSAKRKPRKRGK